MTDPIHSLANSYMTADEDHDESDKIHSSQKSNIMVAHITGSYMAVDKDDHNDST